MQEITGMMISFALKKLRINTGKRQSEVSTLGANWQSLTPGEPGDGFTRSSSCG